MKKITLILLIAGLIFALTGCKDGSGTDTTGGDNPGGNGNGNNSTSYTVTFNANGGTGTMPQQSISASGGTLNTNEFISPDSRPFAAWNTVSDGSGDFIVDRETFTPTVDTTLYAIWGAIYRFHSNQPSGASTTVSGTMDDQFLSASGALDAKQFTLYGYEFDKWNTAADGSGIAFADGATPAGWPPTGSLDLYARWEAKEYTITLSGNGNSVDETVIFDNSTGIILDKPSSITPPTGKVLKEWNSRADGMGDSYAVGFRYAVPPLTAGNLTLHAIWETVYQIGDTGPGGGIIFYDDTVGYDFDGDSTIQDDEKNLITGKRYLEAASSVWNGGGGDPTAGWGPANTPIPELDSISDSDAETLAGTVGSGKANTDEIVDFLNGRGETGHAAQLCADYEDAHDLNDWFLPTLGELAILYGKKDNVGGFSAASHYWSSSERGFSTVWLMGFDDGVANSAGRAGMLRVRPIRAF